MFKINKTGSGKILTAIISAALVCSCTAPLANAYASSETALTVSAESSLSFTESAGYEEGLYAEWKNVSGASGYKAYYSTDGKNYTQVDNELIRSYGSYMRVDAVGLKAGNYNLKVEALDSKGNVLSSKTTDSIEVTAYDRSGFAFSDDSAYSDAPGAYNMDGTLKEGAKVIYVTSNTARTVSTDVIKDKKGTTESYSGMQSIISKYEKGFDTTPIAFRIIGCVTADDMDALNSKEEGLQIKGKSGTPMNITIEGIGEDGSIKDFGILAREAGNLEIRNLGIFNCLDDAVSLDTKNTDIWVHDLDLFYGQSGSDKDQAKGDGTIDVKSDSKFITIAYNHFLDSGKSSLCGMKSESGPNYITYHHNWFDHSDSRHPRVRTMSVHVYNNYFDGNSKYGVGSTTGSDVFVENNYFRNCKFPMLTSLQGNDLFAGSGTSSNDNATFSKEAGGSIKAYNNTIVDSNNSTSYIPYNAESYIMKGKTTSYSSIDTSKHFDAYEVSSRSETVPSSVVSVSGSNTYSNFDSDGSVDLGVDESAIDSPDETLLAKIKAQAGRVNGGDVSYSFKDSSEDTNANVITALKSKVTGYSSSLISVGGIDPDQISEYTEGNEPSEESSDEASTEEPSPTEEASSTEENTNEEETAKTYTKVLKADDVNVGSYSETFTAGEDSFYTISASQEAAVTVDASKKTYEGITFANRIKTGGAGSADARTISFTTSGAGTATVYAISSSKSDVRTLNFSTLSEGEFKVLASNNFDGSAISTSSFEFDSADTYYIYSAGGGINFYYVSVEYKDGGKNESSGNDDSENNNSENNDSENNNSENNSSENNAPENNNSENNASENNDPQNNSSENNASENDSSDNNNSENSDSDNNEHNSEENTGETTPSDPAVVDDSNNDSENNNTENNDSENNNTENNNSENNSSENNESENNDSSVSSNDSVVSTPKIIAGGKINIASEIPGANYFSIDDKAQKKIAHVSKKGIFKAKKGKSGSVTINGYKKESGKKVLVGSYTLNIETPSVTQDTVHVSAVGDTISADSIISCEGFTVSSWTSSNKNVAIVSSSGLVRVLKKGSSRITAIFVSGDKKIKCSFKVIL